MSDLKSLAMEALLKRATGQLGYPRIKPNQLEAVVKLCQGRDVYASLPTSYEKTLIYALPTSIVTTTRERNNSIVLVLGPLIALTAEQKTHTHLVLAYWLSAGHLFGDAFILQLQPRYLACQRAQGIFLGIEPPFYTCTHNNVPRISHSSSINTRKTWCLLLQE